VKKRGIRNGFLEAVFAWCCDAARGDSGDRGSVWCGDGQQKRAAAVEMVGAAINITDAVTKKQIADADKFTAGLNAIIDGVVTCLNASIWAKQ
jgi:hypothetical protein